ncbi:DEAD/DEAH box helicase [Advenella sp. WQ 585]|uniref:DEAD/DEAH box helicase n=1 Tax=Advenella mandrilli TaxID=2800330 RepID=A0ABS1EHS4_9BURK|nr:type ISP restriction/modification enzyme [Advenella mandrilli]MBK1782585.1 DEAD/DEAH box helicase [Advenella mandrilli]
MSPLQTILDSFRQAAVTEREKGTYFEELILAYLRNEATYRDLYSDVWTYSDWAEQQHLDKRDTGIDLVAKTHGTEEYHAIQCKFYAEDYKIQRRDIDSFFTASGQRPFTHRIIISTTNNWSEHAEDALRNQQPPVSKIDFYDLENSQIDWAHYQAGKAPVLKALKTLRAHQKNALEAVERGLATADRGKLIMACGTGKTFTSLKIAEKLAGAGGRVLFLVPSLSLLSQTLTEWTQESEVPLHSFAVCSDSDVGKKRSTDDDMVQTFTHELRYPATTNAQRLAEEMTKRHDNEHMSVVFSTYHSIATISEAQHEFDLAEFDLVICDEAHRTTGATFADEDESAFVRVHDADFLRAKKRLYMTATPRIYSADAKITASESNAAVYSMDSEEHYGKELFVITFSEAVQRGLLVDYKVIVLAVEEELVSRRLQKLLSDENNQLKVDDAAKIVGCWKALAKQGLEESLQQYDLEPMKRAVAFCQVIRPSAKARRHQVASVNIANMFQEVVEAYQEAEAFESLKPETAARLTCEADHIDGSMNASQKEEKLNWLKADTRENTCRILSNVRCLSEGVDVPALDAVLFLTPRNSQVDVVQSVGRVMRTVKDKDGNDLKKLGYVVLPVVIPSGVEPHEALNDNQTYKVVWQVLQALRSHDDRFDAMVNKLELIGQDRSKMEVIAITDKIQQRSKSTPQQKKKKTGKGQYDLGELSGRYPVPQQASLQFEIGEIERAIYAKLVEKVGNRLHWEEWAEDIAKIANTHISRIKGILENPDNLTERASFNAFAAELRDDLNNAISDDEIIEMLAQHLITKPVFDSLFKGYNFTEHNPMSKAMQAVVTALEAHHIDKEADTLQSFYQSVQMRAEGIESAEGKQRIIVELYDKFFRKAFPRMTERLGIVYTPVEVVDFIIHSVEDVMRKEFNSSLADKNVHILDPFTGTGTFITRLLQSGIIPADKLPYKYKNEIHANEIVLLAYYIAAINIEATYHGILSGNVTGKEDEDDITDVPYVPFEGICLTDTFQMYESEDLVDQLLEENSERRKRQKSLDIRVIIGNPPYSIGQASANDNNANIAYPELDRRIESTYVARSSAALSKGMYDSYIRAIRWASDRIGNQGVIGYVTNGRYLETSQADGMRKSLQAEFSSLYIFNLRGDIRKNMLSKGKAGEGQNVFGSGSMAGIAISILVKNSSGSGHGKIYYYDIGADLSSTNKLEQIAKIGSLEGIPKWKTITPDEHGDWLSQRDDSFEQYVVLGDKSRQPELRLFDNFSLGVATNRDAWVYNSSQEKMVSNMQRMITNYNSEVVRFNEAHQGLDRRSRQAAVDVFIDNDPTMISWTRALKQELAKSSIFQFETDSVYKSLYRPFTKQWMYFNRNLNEMVLQMPRIFPNAEAENLVIHVSGVGARSGFSVNISDRVTDLQAMDNGQCFPLYLYDEKAQEQESTQETLFENESMGYELKRRDAITDEGLAHFQEAYPNQTISKEDLFYYVYGILHSEDYRSRFANNLSKELPRIPRVKTYEDFTAFSQAGRQLAELHLNYETVDKYPVTFTGKLQHNGTDFVGATDEDFYVTKMKHPKKKDEETGKSVNDLSKIIYNAKVTLSDIPLEAYDYVVNGKSAIAWVMERQGVSTHKASDIVNDANDWAIETMGNPRYPLELLQRVITVSLETMKVVRGLPELGI